MEEFFNEIEKSCEKLNRILFELKKFFRENPEIYKKFNEFLKKDEELIY